MSDISNSKTPVQSEATRFRSAVSEALLQLIGGNINYLLDSVLPVGSYANSALTEAQFQGQTSNGWVLADGRNCAGSAYALLTGFTTVPDMRGRYMRAKDHGAGVNPDGDLALGSTQADIVVAHNHSIDYTRLEEIGGTIVHDDGSEYLILQGSNTGGVSGATSGAETRPRSMTTNVFFRIN
jgi:hypothetical protein